MTVDNGEVIKTSRRPDIQKRVDNQVFKIQEKHPQMPQSAATNQARDRVAAEITRERLRKERDQANVRATKDNLTGLLNYNGFEDILAIEGRRVARTRKPMAIVILDTNNLKRINDTQGHEAGNQFLRDVADVLTASTRLTDIVSFNREENKPNNIARWGGDEYGVILPDADIQGAKTWWTRVSSALTEKGISIGAGLQILSPEDVNEKSPQEIKEIVTKRKSEADLAMMKIAKPQSKIENKPVLVVYNELSEEIRASLTT